MTGIRQVAAEHLHMPRLNTAGTGDQAQHRRFADAVGADQPDHAAGRKGDRHIVERNDVCVAQRNPVKLADGFMGPVH